MYLNNFNLYFSRKFTYSLYEDHVNYAQITRDNHKCMIVYIIYIDEALFCHVLTLFIFCLYVYSHFENQLEISAIRLGQCLKPGQAFFY